MPPSAEGCSEQGTTRVGLKDAEPDAFARWRYPEMIAHRHLDEGRDVEQLFLALPHAGGTDFVLPDRQHVRVDLAKGVADFVDDEREGAVGAVAKVDRQRIEGEAE